MEAMKIDRLEIYFGYKIRTWCWVRYVYSVGKLCWWKNDMKEREMSEIILGLLASKSGCMMVPLTRRGDTGSNSVWG